MMSCFKKVLLAALFLLRRTRFRAGIIIFLVVIIFLGGCAALQPKKSELQLTVDQTIGDQLFINGNLSAARKEYTRLEATAKTPGEKNYALYGIACIQLLEAKTGEEFIAAASKLQQWDTQKGGAPFIENYQLLILAIEQQATLMSSRASQASKITEQQDSVIEEQKKKITQLTTTIENLREQISELEAIDKTFQEKRRPL